MVLWLWLRLRSCLAAQLLELPHRWTACTESVTLLLLQCCYCCCYYSYAGGACLPRKVAVMVAEMWQRY